MALKTENKNVDFVLKNLLAGGESSLNFSANFFFEKSRRRDRRYGVKNNGGTSGSHQNPPPGPQQAPRIPRGVLGAAPHRQNGVTVGDVQG